MTVETGLCDDDANRTSHRGVSIRRRHTTREDTWTSPRAAPQTPPASVQMWW
jgi:hypothetical protein